MPEINIIKLLLIILSFSILSCSTEFNLNAPFKDVWVVYGVLDQEDSVQYVRISKAFLTEGDALQYAQDSAENVKGLNVVLMSDSKTFQAVEVDSVLKNPTDGTFYPYVSLYKFDTSGANKLEDGKRYELKITDPNDPDLLLLAYTFVPIVPEIRNPRLVPCSGQASALQPLALDFEYKMEFRRPTNTAGVGRGFEIRAFLEYRKDGVTDIATYGPTEMIDDDFRCSAGGNLICYQFREKELITAFKAKLDDPAALYSYQDKPTCADFVDLPKSFWFEVTAIDTFLANYITANDPKFSDFNTVRPEYTNISGSEESLGIFGSITKGIQYAGFDDCTKYLIGLNETQQPRPTCD